MILLCIYIFVCLLHKIQLCYLYYTCIKSMVVQILDNNFYNIFNNRGQLLRFKVYNERAIKYVVIARVKSASTRRLNV